MLVEVIQLIVILSAAAWAISYVLESKKLSSQISKLETKAQTDADVWKYRIDQLYMDLSRLRARVEKLEKPVSKKQEQPRAVRKKLIQ